MINDAWINRFVRHRVYPCGLQAFALRRPHLNLEIWVVQRPVSCLTVSLN